MSIVNTAEARQFIEGRDRLPGDVVIDALANNNTEFKGLVQAPLRVDEWVPLTEIRPSLVDSCGDSDLHTVSYAQMHSVLRAMNPRFVQLGKTDERPMAFQTQEGRFISASTAGHLLRFAIDTNVPLRCLMGESLKPRELPGKAKAAGSIEIRLNVLSLLFEHAREGWLSAVDMHDAAEERKLRYENVRTHVRKLRNIGIVERKPATKTTPGLGNAKGFLYRIKQENGHIPPTETVDRYLGIVLMVSAMDPDFVAQGLDHLEQISQDSSYVPFLLKRSFVNTGHTGKNAKELEELEEELVS